MADLDPPVPPTLKDADTLTNRLLRQLANELAITNDNAATKLALSTKELAFDLVRSNEQIADRLASLNKKLADDLAEANRHSAEHLFYSTRELTNQLLAQNREVSRQVEAITSMRFNRQKKWNWSLIVINALTCVILMFFAFSFFTFAVKAFPY